MYDELALKFSAWYAIVYLYIPTCYDTLWCKPIKETMKIGVHEITNEEETTVCSVAHVQNILWSTKTDLKCNGEVCSTTVYTVVQPKIVVEILDEEGNR